MPVARAFARACAKPFSATNARTSWQVYAEAGVTSSVRAKAKIKVFIIRSPLVACSVAQDYALESVTFNAVRRKGKALVAMGARSLIEFLGHLIARGDARAQYVASVIQGLCVRGRYLLCG